MSCAGRSWKSALPMSRTVAVFLVCLAGSTSAQADLLTDLRTKLQGLRGLAPVHGMLQVKSEDLLSKDDAATRKAMSATVDLGIGAADALTLRVGPDMLEDLNREESDHAANPDHGQPTAELLKETSPAKVKDLLSQADVLSRKLDGATQPLVRPVIIGGKTLTQLSVTRPYRPSKKDKGSVKDYQDTLAIILDGQDIPLQYRETVHGKFCMFFMCMTFDDQRDVTLGSLDHRLYAEYDSDESNQSGLGQEMHTRVESAIQTGRAAVSNGER